MDDPVLSTIQSSTPRKSSRFKRFALFLIVIGLLLIALFVLYHFKFSKNTPSPVKSIPTEYQFPSDTAMPSATTTGTVMPTGKVSATGKLTPTLKASLVPSSPTPTIKSGTTTSSGIDRSTLAVSVQNGSGVVGAGAKAAGILKSAGYNVVSTGNADNFNYINVTIQVKSTKSNFLALLKSDLSSSYTIGSATADLPSTAASDAVVIVGK